MPEPPPGSAGCFVVADKVGGYVFGEVVGVKVDEGAEKHSQLSGGEHCRGMVDDAFEGGDSRLTLFLAAGLLGLVLFLFAVELPLALLLAALLLGLVFLALPFVLGLTLGGFLFGFALRRRVPSQVRDERLAPSARRATTCGLCTGQFVSVQTVMLLPAPLPKTTIAAFVWSHGGSASMLSGMSSSRYWCFCNAPGCCSLGLRHAVSMETR